MTSPARDNHAMIEQRDYTYSRLLVLPAINLVRFPLPSCETYAVDEQAATPAVFFFLQLPGAKVEWQSG